MNTPPQSAAFEAEQNVQQHRIVADRYEIICRLGEGGMSEVWRAYDLKLRMDVALKTVRQSLEQNPETLRAEIRTAREVISPNICRIFDLVIDGTQELISMEYIDGVTLSALLIQKSPLSFSEMRDMAAQFLAGLEAIHNAGFVHCDLKPENIMITRTGRVVVMDFGIARQALEQSDKVSGTLPYMAPERFSGNVFDARSDLFSAGVILAEMTHPRRILTEATRAEIWDTIQQDPLQLEEGPWKNVILRAIALNPEERFPSASVMARALEEATEGVQRAEERKPYPGLASFTAADREYFFGRELEIETLIKNLQQHHLMAVIGPSGAGKTSFLRAGVIPALPENWGCIFSVPGESPLLNLGQALIPQISKDTESMLRVLRFEDPAAALELLGEWRQKHAEALLIIDRFEELFTLNTPENQSRFAELISNAALEADIRVLLCMRDDFLFRCHEHPGLQPIFSAIIPLGPLNGPALRRALIQPALSCGYAFENEELIDEILVKVEKERGALPLMAFCASRLWQKRDRTTGRITRRAYDEIGGVAGALARHAEETMERIGLKRDLIVREIFRNLITSQNTRATRDTEELLSVFTERDIAEEVLRTLIDSRLLTSFDHPALEGEKPRRRIEIIHESLLSAWPRLVRWQTQDADGAQLRDQLRQAAQVWTERDRSKDLLWTGTAFLDFQAWRDRYPGGLTVTEEAFAQAMTQNATKKRRERRILISTTFVILLFVLAIVIGLWHTSTVSRNEAVLKAKAAEASKILALARAQVDVEPTTKLAYAIASLEFADSQEGRRLAIQALSEGPPAQVAPLAMLPSALATDFTPDGKLAVLFNSMALLPSDGGKPIVPDNSPVCCGIPARMSSDGKFLVSTRASDQRRINIWSVPERKVVRSFLMNGISRYLVRRNQLFLLTDATGKLVFKEFEDANWTFIAIRSWEFGSKEEPKLIGEWNQAGVSAFSIDASGKSIYYAKDRTLFQRPFLVSGIGPEKIIGSSKGKIDRIFFTKDDTIITTDETCEFRFWSTPVRIFEEAQPPDDLLFNSNATAVWEVREKQLYFRDLTAPKDAEPYHFRIDDVNQRLVTDGNDRILAVSTDTAVRFYPLNQQYPYEFHSTYKGWGSHNVRFTADGKSLINGFSDAVRIWSLPGSNSPYERTLSGPTPEMHQAFDLDPSGKSIAVDTQDGIKILSIVDGKTSILSSDLPQFLHTSLSFSPDGKFLAAATMQDGPKTHRVEIWDLQSGRSRALNETNGKPFFSVKFAPDGSLFAGDLFGNVYQWNSKEDSIKILKFGKGIIPSLALTKDGRYLAAVSLSTDRWDEVPRATSDIVIYDLASHKSIPIRSHGNRVFSITFDPKGEKVITGDLDGVVRVGSVSGDTPHLLFGHSGLVSDVAADPTGRWIASTELFKPDCRLWPMPEGTPLQSLPYRELLNRLYALTNVRLVADKNATTGYRIQFAPFRGWEKLEP